MMKRLLLTVVILLLLPGLSGGYEERILPGDTLIGVRGGHPSVQGNYREYLENPYLFGLFINSFVFSYVMLEADFLYGRYPIRDTRSRVEEFSAGGSPLLYYTLYPPLQIFGGPFVRGSYLKLDARLSGREERTFKPVFGGTAGLLFPLGAGFGGRVGYEYSRMQLSGKTLALSGFFAAISYNFDAAARRVEEKRPPAERGLLKIAEAEAEYNRGVRLFKEGKLAEARLNFERVLKIRPKHEGSVRYLALIRETVETYGKALSLVDEKRYYDAIPLLQKAAAYLPEASDKLKEIRQLLSGEIRKLAREGVALYEKKEYARCIAVMQRLLLIDPENRTAKIYLPRAKKRHEALKKLR